MNLKFNSREKIFLIPVVIVLIFAVYFTTVNVQKEAELRKLRGPEWIAYDSEGRLHFTYRNNVYSLSRDNGLAEKLIETDLKINSGAIMDIAIAPSGDIFLTDPISHQIHIYSPKGTFKYSLEGHFKENAKIVVDNERIYLADMQGNRVIALGLKQGEIVWTNDGYHMPDSLFIANSMVYVSDADNKLVRTLNAQNGTLIKDINTDFSGFVYGSAVSVLNDGSFLLALAYEDSGAIIKFSEDGNVIQNVSGPKGFAPLDMAIDPQGNVTITDDENYAFYLLRGDIVELAHWKGIEQLFGDMREERMAATKGALYSKVILLSCVIMLLAVYIRYRNHVNQEKESFRDRTETSKTNIIPTFDKTTAIKPKKENPIIIIIGIVLLLVFTYFRVQGIASQPVTTSGIVRLAYLLLIWTLLMGSFLYRRKNPKSGVLELNSLGLLRGTTMYRWHDIDHFGIIGTKIVFWNLKESSTSLTLMKKFSRFESGYDDGVFLKNYEIPAGDLVNILNEYKVHYTGQRSAIEYKKGLNRNLTKKQLLLFGSLVGFIVIFVILHMILNY